MENIANKVSDIVNKSLNKYIGGEKFFDQLDKEFKKPENIDIIKHMFQVISTQNGMFYNIVVSGKFGDWIKTLIIDKKIIPFNGTFLHVSGSLTSHEGFLNKIKEDKQIEIIYKSGDIQNKEFIFFDDSYYSGSTNRSISNFLILNNSLLKKTYVIYDGSDKTSNDRWSYYNYYKHHTGTRLPLTKLLSKLHSLNLDIPIEMVETKILKGNITTMRELFMEIKSLLKKFNSSTKLPKDAYMIPHRYESIKIKKFYQFINESEKYNDIEKFISREDIEDQFLRLKEVFNCEINSRNLGIVWNTRIILPETSNRIKEIEDEIKEIEQRMKNMYPIKISYFDNKINNNIITVNGRRWIYFNVTLLPEFKYT